MLHPKLVRETRWYIQKGYQDFKKYKRETQSYTDQTWVLNLNMFTNVKYAEYINPRTKKRLVGDTI